VTEGYYGILSALRRSGPVSFVAQTHPIDMPTSLPPVIELELQSQAQLPEIISPLPEGPDANRRGHGPSVGSGRDANRRGRGPSVGISTTGPTHVELEGLTGAVDRRGRGPSIRSSQAGAMHIEGVSLTRGG